MRRKHSAFAFVAAFVAALGLAFAPVAQAEGRSRAAAPVQESIPIELPDAPARPSPDEVVGGFHGFLIFMGIAAVITIGVLLAVDHDHHHHHARHAHCEDSWHHD